MIVHVSCISKNAHTKPAIQRSITAFCRLTSHSTRTKIVAIQSGSSFHFVIHARRTFGVESSGIKPCLPSSQRHSQLNGSSHKTDASDVPCPIRTFYHPFPLLGHSLITSLGRGSGSSLTGSGLHRHGLFQGVVACCGTMNIFFEHGLSLDHFELGGHSIEELSGCIAAATRFAGAVEVVHVLKLFSVAAPNDMSKDSDGDDSRILTSCLCHCQTS